MPKPSWLREGDHVVAAWGAHASGPGWNNQPLWILVRSRLGELREECLQPQQQTEAMRLLYDVSAVAMDGMTKAVRIWATK